MPEDGRGTPDHNETLRDKMKSILRRFSDLEKSFRSTEMTVHDLDARVRVLESEDLERLKQDIYKMESRLRSFESEHDKRKENWKMIINFAVQLIWVSMAAWLLAKLGLQAPL